MIYKLCYNIHLSNCKAILQRHRFNHYRSPQVNFQFVFLSSSRFLIVTRTSQSGFGIAFQISAYLVVGSVHAPSTGFTSYCSSSIATKLKITFVEKWRPGHIDVPAPKGRNAEVLDAFFLHSGNRKWV